MSNFASQRHDCANRIDLALQGFLTPRKLSGSGIAPDILVEAIRHGVLNGGKRLRPILLIQSAAIFSISEKQATRAAMAVELVHCYSLIHDDLPAMDNDDLRRGQPTVHKAYDEATAILAGDALLAHAFELLSHSDCHPDPQVRIDLVAELAKASGAGGMAGGQSLDLQGEKTRFSEKQIEQMQKMKTGALIYAAVRMGAIIGGADEKQLLSLSTYAQAAGRAFQLADDILDLTASTEQMGKTTGKDAAAKKPTLVARIGLKAAKRHLGDTIHTALSALMMFGPKADDLRATARFFGDRES
ncbi:MAG: polyprenyl synthetase family protein [Devosiaceae bacterium]|nr:polyprenyl synthetase family protein [Devosiaceae bacterium]